MFKDLINKLKYKVCTKNYSKILEQLKHKIKTKPLKVVFLVRENQKWTYQSLYDEFDKSEHFEPLVLVSLLMLAHRGKDKTRNNLHENLNFFKNKGMNVDLAYKDGKYIDLKEFAPDIVFYDQQWDLPKIHKPLRVSNFALTMYCPYFYGLLENKEGYFQNFHKLLYKYFVENEILIKRYEKIKKDNSKNCISFGYPKLDNFLEAKNDEYPDIWKDKNKFKVIYAPHHSFEQNGVSLATFKDNGKFILELAKNNPQTTWILKPHPRFKYALLRNNIMTEKEIEEYYHEWEQIGTIYEKGEYGFIFKDSDLMITDCCSFLMEYLLTEKPLIRLVNSHSVKLNEIGEKIMSGYYLANNNDELKKYFYDIIEQKDFKKENRQNLKLEFCKSNESGKEIYKYMYSIMKG